MQTKQPDEDLNAPTADRKQEAVPLRLLLVSNSSEPAYVQGADRDWVSLLNALGPDQVRVTWVGLKGTARLRGQIDERVLAQTIDINHPCFYELMPGNAGIKRSKWLWTKVSTGTSLGLTSSLLKLRAALHGSEIDLVISNTAVVLLGALFARFAKRPHIWNVKEYLDPSVKGCRRYAAAISRLSAAVVVPSRIIAEPFASPVHVLPDGNDLQHIESSVRSDRVAALRSLGLPSDLPMVAQLGAISERKGQQVTAAAFAKLAQQGGPPPFSLVFLGNGSPEELERAKQPLAGAPANWQELVKFSSYGPDDLSLVAAADIVVHPSLFNDAFPNAVREAMSLGKPVIASNIGGMPDMLVDGESGFLLPAGDVDAWSRFLAELIHEPERLRRVGDNAARFARDHFDINVRKLDYLKLLNEVHHRRLPGTSVSVNA